jgi:hypothetical protein
MYRRMRGRVGHNQAIFAVAHQILRIAYTMLRRRENYRELGSDYNDQRNKPKVVHRLVQRLTRLGYEVWLEEGPEPASTATATIEPPMTGSAPAAEKELPNVATVSPGKRGRPCKCAERGIACTHTRENSAVQQSQTTDESPT